MNQKSLPLSVSAFITNENKALLWSVLHGGGKFTGIPDKQLHNIQEMFELTIREMSEHYRRLNQPTDLSIMNKEAVIVICKKIESAKMQQSQQQQQQPYQNHPQQIYQKKQQQVPQLETVYTAQELQKERQNAFQNEFKKKEEEMYSILRLKKPEEINFTDDVYDKPIGNDMERLLAEALASREKELEQIKIVAFAPPPSLSENSGIKENEKRVSFGSQLHVIENRQQQNESYYENENENENENEDISFIFNKLKKIKTQKSENEQRQTEYQGNHVNENNNNNIHTTIIKMSQDIEYIKTALAELLEKVNKL